MSRITPSSKPQTQSSKPHSRSSKQWTGRVGERLYLTTLLKAEVVMAVKARIRVETRRHQEEWT